jgi:hypothetical protein
VADLVYRLRARARNSSRSRSRERKARQLGGETATLVAVVG